MEAVDGDGERDGEEAFLAIDVELSEQETPNLFFRRLLLVE